VQFDVVTRLDFGVEGSSLRKEEPVLNLVGKFDASFFSLDVSFKVDVAFDSSGVDFEGGKLIVDEVVGDEGVGLPGPLCPWVDFDAFGLEHVISQLNK
jgi:hypothetical protein